MYILDALLMFLVLLVFIFIHPSPALAPSDARVTPRGNSDVEQKMVEVKRVNAEGEEKKVDEKKGAYEAWA